MSIAGKIRRIQAEPHIDELKEFCRQSHAECNVRIAEIQLVENLLDRIDAAVAARDYTLARQLVGEWAAAYSSVKGTSDQERELKKSCVTPKPNRSYYLKKCLKSNRIAPATTATVTRSMMATNAFLLAADSYDCTKETRLGQK